MRSCCFALALVACSPAAPVARAPVAAPVARVASPGSGDRGLEPPVPGLRLPRHFVPADYAASLAIDPARDEFDGTIAITGELVQRSSVIWLHGQQLAVKRARALRGGVEVPIAVTPHGDDLLELRAAKPLDAGRWTLALEYTGHYDLLNTTGVFKQFVGGAPYVYSQFEALYARRAFPCFDEPDSKVPWQLTLEVPAELVAVSNTPVVREQAVTGGRKRVVFARTRPLPSYLIAFGVGPFDVVDAGKSKSGVPVRVVVMKGRAPEAAWAAATSARLIDLLEEFFGTRYPYEKMDMLAVPVTVGFSAMENAGLITFAETVMLIEPRHAARQREYGWIHTAAHELAHQWFGDLVTTAWWDDIWLNEGFANWVENKITARFESGWHEDLAEIRMRSSALEGDSLSSARQIRQPIANDNDVLNAFDGITYDKGASVLNMFESYLGPEVFRRGVRAYIAEHADGNATSTEFAAAISRAAGVDVGPAFASFLERPGAPELTAALVCEPDRPPRVALAQRRYVPPGSPLPAASEPWRLPVCVAYERAGVRAEACTMLGAQTGELALEAGACPRWLMPNLGGRGYYRAAYTAAQVAALRDQAWPQLAAAEQQAVFFDVAAQAQRGVLPLALALSFVPRELAGGDRFAVGAALAMPLSLRDFVPDELRQRYEAWLRRSFGAAAHRAGLAPNDQDSLDVETVRGALIDAVVSVGRDPVLSGEAVKLASHWHDVPEGIRSQVLAIAAHASAAAFDRLFQDALTEPERGRRLDLLAALAGVGDEHQQAVALGLLLDPRLDIRDTEFMLFMARDEPNRVVAQRFFRDHRAEILQRMPLESTTNGQAEMSRVFTASCVPGRRGEIVDYVTRTFAGLTGGARPVQQAIEAMDQCIARRRLIEPEIRSWLTGAGSSTVPTGPGGARRRR